METGKRCESSFNPVNSQGLSSEERYFKSKNALNSNFSRMKIEKKDQPHTMEGSIKESRVQDEIVEASAPSRHEFLPCNQVDFAKLSGKTFLLTEEAMILTIGPPILLPTDTTTTMLLLQQTTIIPTLEDIVTL